MKPYKPLSGALSVASDNIYYVHFYSSIDPAGYGAMLLVVSYTHLTSAVIDFGYSRDG